MAGLPVVVKLHMKIPAIGSLGYSPCGGVKPDGYNGSSFADRSMPIAGQSSSSATVFPFFN